ncbi:hypothetical protein JOB18_041712 [Solea senegalensis]|uniref:Uncharacterized protein n=1 Tax=Solea senegalensis TaxID=28829 RepID=A0AAV6PL64_SOLSE|nr:hypothetical protein JOB18_041712 [Solea senegalensis]
MKRQQKRQRANKLVMTSPFHVPRNSSSFTAKVAIVLPRKPRAACQSVREKQRSRGTVEEQQRNGRGTAENSRETAETAEAAEEQQRNSRGQQRQRAAAEEKRQRSGRAEERQRNSSRERQQRNGRETAEERQRNSRGTAAEEQQQGDDGGVFLVPCQNKWAVHNYNDVNDDKVKCDVFN